MNWPPKRLLLKAVPAFSFLAGHVRAGVQVPHLGHDAASLGPCGARPASGVHVCEVRAMHRRDPWETRRVGMEQISVPAEAADREPTPRAGMAKLEAPNALEVESQGRRRRSRRRRGRAMHRSGLTRRRLPGRSPSFEAETKPQASSPAAWNGAPRHTTRLRRLVPETYNPKP